MSDSVDLRRLLQSWPYEPDNDTRVVAGDNGREILQVRTVLGIEQHELDGRPDGGRPHGMESVLDFHLRRLETVKASGEEAGFDLSPAQCAELFNEGTLYYYRYVRLFQMKDWPRTIRDTARNLRAFDFIHRYAQREEDQQFLEKWRPYVLRVNGSAQALLQLEKKNYDAALRTVNETIAKIEALDELEDDTFRFERERSLTALRELGGQIRKNRPLSELERLEGQLRRAIEAQNFERAAQLRDRIRELRKQHIC